MDRDLTIGFVLIGCALLMFPLMMNLMQEHDDSVREHERECDIEYRLLVLNTIESPDPVLCKSWRGKKRARRRTF